VNYVLSFEPTKYKNMTQPDWKTAKEYEDITYTKCNGVARIAFNRPNVRNAFRPKQPKNYMMRFMMLAMM
jgi:1,4-dihydroxy-2-naphthoyl-CoA synthase